MQKITHFYFDEIDSTNDELKRRFHSDDRPADWTVVSAGHQTAGKGRSGHEWKSPTEDSVATSLIFYPKVQIRHVPRLTILSGMAVAAALEKLYALPTRLKWPNDVLIHERKICGILCEMEPDGDRAAYVIVGIGVNVHQKDFPEDIRDMATSVDLELKKSEQKMQSSRKDIDRQIWLEFARLYQEFEKTEDLSDLLDEYNKRLVNVNQTVRVLDPLGEYQGKSLGIDRRGDLLVQREDGSIVAVDSGEVHVRGIYGYV
ncbi:MAG: biotin--[acetyl-CoA-carboxylase] ligase [Lachnospiraceae bacterium]|nr:biotin--[acetyl-CoA-carboxylase] ligase [Lachnospiraceae bacterium]